VRTGKLRYLVMVRLGESAVLIPTGILARPLRELIEMPTDDPWSMSTFFPCHSVIAGDRAALIWIRKAALSPLNAATPAASLTL
jgi:hypothetical protein